MAEALLLIIFMSLGYMLEPACFSDAGIRDQGLEIRP